LFKVSKGAEVITAGKKEEAVRTFFSAVLLAAGVASFSPATAQVIVEDDAFVAPPVVAPGPVLVPGAPIVTPGVVVVRRAPVVIPDIVVVHRAPVLAPVVVAPRACPYAYGYC
jgi:hypothetical protein